MGRPLKFVKPKSRMLGTEINFGLVLLNICNIELSLGDLERAICALSEARAIHERTSSMLRRPKVAPILRRTALKLARGVSRADRNVSESHQVLYRPGAEDGGQDDHHANQIQRPLTRSASAT
jgi:hypothetical protein